MTLTLNNWYIQDTEGGFDVIDSSNPQLRALSIGNRYTLYAEYLLTGASVTPTTEIRFNPALFIGNDNRDATNLDIENETYYMTATGVTSTFSPMTYVGPPNAYITSRNEEYEVRTITATSFVVKFTFFMTVDTYQFLGRTIGNQSAFLTKNNIFNVSLFSNTGTSIYNENSITNTQRLGLYCRVKSDGGAGATATWVDVGDRRFANQMGDPFHNGSYTYTYFCNFFRDASVLNTFLSHADNCIVPPPSFNSELATLTYTNIDNPSITGTMQIHIQRDEVTADTLPFYTNDDITILTGASSSSRYMITIEELDCSVGGTRTETYGSLPTATPAMSIRRWDFLNIRGRFYNFPYVNSPSFSLIRGGQTVSRIHNTNPTTVRFTFNKFGTFNRGKLWLIPRGIPSNTTTWWKDALLRPSIQFSNIPTITNPSGGLWQMEVSLNPITLGMQAGDVYDIVFVIFEDSEFESAPFVFQSVQVSSLPEAPGDVVSCVPQITGKMFTLDKEYETTSLIVSPLQRVRGDITFDKTAFQLCGSLSDITELNIRLSDEANVTFSQIQLPVVNGVPISSTPNVVITDGAQFVTISYRFTILDTYRNKDMKVQYTFSTANDPYETTYTQVFRVTDYQQNLTTPTLTNIEFVNGAGISLASTDRNCNLEDLTVRVTKTGSDNYGIAAVWSNNLNQVVETTGYNPATTFVPRVTNPNLINVNEDFAEVSPDNQSSFIMKPTIQTGNVGIVSYIKVPEFQSTSRLFFHLSYPNGLKTTLKTLNNFTSLEKTYSVYNIESETPFSFEADVTFKIANNNDALYRDANSPAWDSLPSLTWNQFKESPIPICTWVRLELPNIPISTILSSNTKNLNGLWDYAGTITGFVLEPFNSNQNSEVRLANWPTAQVLSLGTILGGNIQFVNWTNSQVLTGNPTISNVNRGLPNSLDALFSLNTPDSYQLLESYSFNITQNTNETATMLMTGGSFPLETDPEGIMTLNNVTSNPPVGESTNFGGFSTYYNNKFFPFSSQQSCVRGEPGSRLTLFSSLGTQGVRKYFPSGVGTNGVNRFMNYFVLGECQNFGTVLPIQFDSTSLADGFIFCGTSSQIGVYRPNTAGLWRRTVREHSRLAEANQGIFWLHGNFSDAFNINNNAFRNTMGFGTQRFFPISTTSTTSMSGTPTINFQATEFNGTANVAKTFKLGLGAPITGNVNSSNDFKRKIKYFAVFAGDSSSNLSMGLTRTKFRRLMLSGSLTQIILDMQPLLFFDFSSMPAPQPDGSRRFLNQGSDTDVPYAQLTGHSGIITDLFDDSNPIASVLCNDSAAAV